MRLRPISAVAQKAQPKPHPAWVEMEAAIEDEVEQALYDKKTAREAVTAAHRRLNELAGKQ